MAEKILKNPPELDRLYRVRARLAGTDRDDHIEELNIWEGKIKKALIALNLKGHEGITMLIDRAKDEIREINDVLTSTRPVNLSAEGAQQYAYEAARLHDKKSMWEWFMEFFQEAETSISEAGVFLSDQEFVDEEDPYKGSSPQGFM